MRAPACLSWLSLISWFRLKSWSQGFETEVSFSQVTTLLQVTHFPEQLYFVNEWDLRIQRTCPFGLRRGHSHREFILHNSQLVLLRLYQGWISAWLFPCPDTAFFTVSSYIGISNKPHASLSLLLLQESIIQISSRKIPETMVKVLIQILF